MKGITVPEQTEDFTADPVELFFDLAYVLAISQLVGRVVDQPSWAGVGDTALLFGLLWLPWQQLTWAANMVSGRGRDVRLIFLAATTVSVPVAASTSTALHDGGRVFAVGIGLIMALGFAMQVLAVDLGSARGRAVVWWATPNVVALVVLLVGSLADGGARRSLWLLATAIVLVAMILAGRNEWLIRTGHFAERHGLIVIIALGEVIVATGLPVIAALEVGRGVPAASTVALAACGAFAGLMWWSYFDRPGPALEHRASGIEGDRHRGRFVRDVYTWAHAPIVAGIILAAAALEHIALHPTDPLPVAHRALLAGGASLVLLGILAAVWRAFGKVAPERAAALPLIAVVVGGLGPSSGLVALIGLDVALAAMLALEHRRIES